jgi:DNA-3-methyladenine glycosylase I
MFSYCEYARSLDKNNYHRKHHDTEHGSVAKDDDDLFRRLILEINQAGLSFDTILKKKEAIYAAFPNVKKASGYTEKGVNRLMQNSGIIRNRLKIEAAIFNAKKIIELQKTHGSFRNWLDLHHPKSKEEWVKLFRKSFKFTGGEILNEFLMSSCYLPGAHVKGCRRYKERLHGNIIKKIKYKIKKE